MRKQIFFQNRFWTACFFLFLPSFNAVWAQSVPEPHQAKKYTTYNTKISLLAFGIGVISAPAHSENLAVSFPYQTLDASGIKQGHVFTGTTNHLLSKQSPEILFGLDISRPGFVINFSAGLNTAYKGAFYSAGSGMNLYLGHKGSSREEKIKKCTWVIRPSLNLAYFSFSAGALGYISNTHTTIYALGSEADPTFEYQNIFSFNPQLYGTTFFRSYTIEADKLIISFKQYQIGIQPKIAICTNPYKKHYSIQIFAGYFIPLYQSSGLVLKQYNNKYDRNNFISGSGTNNITDHTEITATYNNHSFTSVPFRANNIFIGFILGFTLRN